MNIYRQEVEHVIQLTLKGMSTISEILHEDAWHYLQQLKREDLLDLVNEHRTAERYIAASTTKPQITLDEVLD